MIEEAVYRIVSATPLPPLLYHASTVAPYRMHGGKFPPFLCKIFIYDPSFFACFR